MSVCVWLFSCVVMAQELSVDSFSLLENDLTANTYGTMERDQNGEVAALIKVVTSETGFAFDGGMMGIVKTVQKTGEIWVYVPHSIQKITISHQQLGVLRDYYFPIAIEKARTYELKLTAGKVRTIVEQALTSQYVVFKVQPDNAIVFIDDEEPRSLDSQGMLPIRLKRGKHTYRVTAASYVSETGEIDVQTEKITKEIILKSSKALLTVSTASDAEIWINDVQKGIGNWTGELDAGDYLVEARKPSHHTIRREITLHLQENSNLSLGEPIPISGIIDIQSTPIESEVYLDGKLIGQTPLVADNILIGDHVLTIIKNGYQTVNQNINIEEGTTLSRTFTLQGGGNSVQNTAQTAVNRNTSVQTGNAARTDIKPEFVDLGLSVKWATFNVGATKPEEYGEYYAWGETDPKPTYNWKTYKWCDGTSSSLTKYCSQDIYGYAGYKDYKKELDRVDDVATVKWGENWRMPTINEWRELLNKCKVQYYNLNGVAGYLVTSKKAGYSGRSIFLPFAGVREGAKLNNAGIWGLYRSSSIDRSDSSMARNAFLKQDSRVLSFDYRFGGLPVRPVCP